MLPLPPAFFTPSIASTLLLPASGVIPPPSTGVFAPATGVGAAVPLALGMPPGLAPAAGCAFLPDSITYGVPSCCCTALNLLISAAVSLVAAFCSAATSSARLRSLLSFLFLLGWMPWKLQGQAGGQGASAAGQQSSSRAGASCQDSSAAAR